MSQFNFFHDNWLDYNPCLNAQKGEYISYLPIHLPKNFFQNLQLDRDSIQTYKKQAAEISAEQLGNNFAICFSGGIDSQAMLQCFIEAKLDFKVYILKFKNDLNKQDVDHAQHYCKVNKIKLLELPFDIIGFLNKFNLIYSSKYKSLSPHFNTHYAMFDILRSKGHTGIVCGGNATLCNNNTWGTNYTRNPMNYINYSEINNFFVQGNFLSFFPTLNWAIALLTKKNTESLTSNNLLNKDELDKNRYLCKLNGYVRANFNIIPQNKKYTGFELVKKYYESLTNDPWEFEKRFRVPLSAINCYDSGHTEFMLTDEQKNELEILYNAAKSETMLCTHFDILNKSFYKDESNFNNMRPW